ncbi:MAG: hypothetical protein B6D57_04920 [Candidatus Coatesbacteria bacterium 4484_99]|uniref:GWxTD domain-containing protein n=1 Tax=Candidatus Coatesbacteria bacterium 4484_99 TaxID=1970774 RepID=A0A1W9RZZ1_9BACT|nr:MAG: hypothetical protein B6D57_04920 [Candidatus Coatesbacteria bacterium 4484_99]
MIILFLFMQIEYQAVNRLINDAAQELTIYFKIPRNCIKLIAEDSSFYASYETQLKVLQFLVRNKKARVKRIVFLIEDIKEEVSTQPELYRDSLAVFVGNLPIDRYSLKIELFSEKQKLDEMAITVKIERPFYLDDDAWKLKVEQLRYIATYGEMQKLKKAEVGQRDSLWQAFWEKHDPTPNTKYNEKKVEYFERIKYCDEHFSHGDKGWRSDRAKIYVRYGAPDEIERRPYEIDAYPYEIWFYYKMNLKFIFVDRYGFGQYILINEQGSNI